MSKQPDFEIPTHDGRLFTWSGRSAIIEASDFGQVGTVWHRRVWNDACDTGFLVQGLREKRLFTFVREKRSERSDELLGWVFSDGQGNTIVVLND
jgi:hypothetical protein